MLQIKSVHPVIPELEAGTWSGCLEDWAQWKAEATSLGEMRLPPHSRPGRSGQWRSGQEVSGGYLPPHCPTILTIQGKVCFLFFSSRSFVTFDPFLMLSTSNPPIM